MYAVVLQLQIVYIINLYIPDARKNTIVGIGNSSQR